MLVFFFFGGGTSAVAGWQCTAGITLQAHQKKGQKQKCESKLPSRTWCCVGTVTLSFVFMFVPRPDDGAQRRGKGQCRVNGGAGGC